MTYRFTNNTFNPLRNIFWYLLPGIKVSVSIPPSHSPSHFYSMPLYHYDNAFEQDLGSWLTDNIGKQGSDWDWRVVYFPSYSLSIKLTKSKQHLSSIFLLRWT